MPIPSVSSSGAYLTTGNDQAINTPAVITGTGTVLFVLAQKMASAPFSGDLMRAPLLDGVAMSRVIGPFDLSLWAIQTTAGTRTVRTQTASGSYGAHQISWQAWQDTASSGARYGAEFANQETSTAITTGSQTCPSGGAIAAFYTHQYGTFKPTVVGGTTETLGVFVNGGISHGAGYRPTTGAVAWTASDAQWWFVVGMAIYGDAPPSIVSGDAVLDGVTASGGVAPTPPSSVSGGAQLDDITAGGTVGVAPGVLTSSKLWTNVGIGSPHTSAPFEAFVSNKTTGVLVLRKAGLNSSASSSAPTCSFSDGLLTPGSQYRVTWRRTDTGAEGTEVLTAA